MSDFEEHNMGAYIEALKSRIAQLEGALRSIGDAAQFAIDSPVPEDGCLSEHVSIILNDILFDARLPFQEQAQ